jgi:hypothetical protein
MILILSNPTDVHARHIAEQLRERGCDVLTLSRSDFGNGASIDFRPGAKLGEITLADGTKIASEEVSVVWYRRPGIVRANPAITDTLDRSFAENEWSVAVDGFLTVAFRRIVNQPLRQRSATKPLQLALASQIGLRAPETLITSNPKEALAFVTKHQGAVVHKAMTAPPHQFIDTRAWDSNAYRHIRDLPLCPTMLQERIYGPADVRATVVGKRLLSACIQTARGRAGIDSRLDTDAPCAPYELPSDVESAILHLMEELGLVFGTIDLKLADNGEHVFLEVNPQGQFLYIEILTGLPISNTLVEFLVSE